MSPELTKVLEELRGITNNFGLRGNGVAGNLIEGFTVRSMTTGGSAGGGPTPPPACPSSATITFSGVIFDCGCTRGATGDHVIATDIGGFNDIPVTLSTPYTCLSLPNPDCGLIADAGTLTYHRKLWFTSPDCSGVPDADTDRQIFDVIIDKFGSLWTVLAADVGAVFFYGTTTDILSPLTNQASCDTEIDDTCYGLPLFGAAHGGTATVILS